MNHTSLTKKHYSYTIEKDIREICEPLKQYHINVFNYVRFFNDGTFLLFTNLWEASCYHLKKQYVFSPSIPPNKAVKKFHYILRLDNITDDLRQSFLTYRDLFGTDHPIFFYEIYGDYIDFFVYSMQPEQQNSTNFYINNIDLLENFKFYFKDKAHQLIQKANKNRIILPDNMRLKTNNSNVKCLKQPFKIKRYIISGKHGEVQITHRELEVIRSFSQGCSAKEAAIMLNVSPRTIEYYFNNVKLKLGLEKKSSIIRKLSDHGLF